MTDHHENGNGKLYVTNKWLLGILVSIVLTLAGYIFLSNISRIDAKDITQDSATQNNLAQIQSINQNLAGMNALLQSIDGRTSRIERHLNIQ